MLVMFNINIYLLKWASIGVAAVMPSGFPAAFAPSWRRIANAAIQTAFCSGSEFQRGRLPRRDISHFHEYPHQAPSLSLVALGRVGAVPFEIDVIDQSIGAMGGG